MPHHGESHREAPEIVGVGHGTLSRVFILISVRRNEKGRVNRFRIGLVEYFQWFLGDRGYIYLSGTLPWGDSS